MDVQTVTHGTGPKTIPPGYIEEGYLHQLAQPGFIGQNLLSTRRKRLPTSDPRRIQCRDAKLLKRDSMRANDTEGKKVIFCPCVECGGIVKRRVDIALKHVMKHGRHPSCRGPKVNDPSDSSDEEWQQILHSSNHPTETAPVIENVQESARIDFEKVTNDIDENFNIEQMLNDMFVDLDQIQSENFQDLHVGNDDSLLDDSSIPFEQGNEESDNRHQNVNEMRGDPESELRDACKPLFEGAKVSQLAFVMSFLNICSSHSVPNKCVDELLSFMAKLVLPKKHIAPKNMYFAKRLLMKLGLNYYTIDACPQGHVLFRGDLTDVTECPHPDCGEARYKLVGKSKVATCKVRVFPLIPRLLRQYKCPSIAHLMTWASENKSSDGKVRSAAYSNQWKHVDHLYPDFAQEPRNLRFGLALDGVNPFGNQSTTYSTWPIMLLNYNLPPWLTTKRFFVMLAMIIPGPKSIKARNIDVFLAPVKEELEKIWEGVEAYDVLRRNGKSKFKLRGMLLWTVNDYPAYGLISGLKIKGKGACALCGPRVTSDWSLPCKKPIFLGHRRWLPFNHAYRKSHYSQHFNLQTEKRGQPGRSTADEILEWAEQRQTYLDNGGKIDGTKDPYKEFGVYRRSILFDLPYWKHLLVRHTVDVMHIEKNVTYNVVQYLLGANDAVKVRNDLKVRGIRPELWCKPKQSGSSKSVMTKPHAPYVMTDQEKEIFLKRLENLMVPSDYSARWSTHVNWKKTKLQDMKSHDWHILMQQLLPACMRGLMQPTIRNVIGNLSSLFRKLCLKVYDPRSYESLKELAAITLCRLEMYFPPAFFDVMTHLIIHAIEELHICGPQSARWMYPMERFMKLLKKYVRTYARPEASMAEGYIYEEALGCITEYMFSLEGIGKRVWDAKEDLGVSGELLEGGSQILHLTKEERDAAHEYVLEHAAALAPWRRKYAEIFAQGETNSVKFATWIEREMTEQMSMNVPTDMDCFHLAFPPPCKCKSYKRIMAKGNHYRVQKWGDNSHVTYDGGITLFCDQQKLVDGELIWVKVEYVGEITQILKLDYGPTSLPVILLKARWVNPTEEGYKPATKRDNDGYKIVNFKNCLSENDDPYVFATQVEQVFFMRVEKSNPREDWRVVLHKECRNRRVFQEGEESNLDDSIMHDETSLEPMPLQLHTIDLPEAEALTEKEAFEAAIDYSKVQLLEDIEDDAGNSSEDDEEDFENQTESEDDEDS